MYVLIFLFPDKQLYINTPPAGDDCQTIIAKFSISLAEFLAWNPAVSSDCTSGLWVEEDYCVGVTTSSTTATATTTTSSTTATSTSTSAAVTPPAPTQSGIPANCNEYYVAQCTLYLSFLLFLVGCD